jgi:hypothetical protein
VNKPKWDDAPEWAQWLAGFIGTPPVTQKTELDRLMLALAEHVAATETPGKYDKGEQEKGNE